MSNLIHLNNHEKKLRFIHDYFQSDSTSMLIILSKDFPETMNIMMEVVNNCRDRIRKMRILGEDSKPHKFAFTVPVDTLKLIYFAETMTPYIEEIAYDWNAVCVVFEKSYY